MLEWVMFGITGVAVWLLAGYLGAQLFNGTQDSPLDWRGWNRHVLTEEGQMWFAAGFLGGGCTLTLFAFCAVGYAVWKPVRFLLLWLGRSLHGRPRAS